jgi:hypothetical protein
MLWKNFRLRLMWINNSLLILLSAERLLQREAIWKSEHQESLNLIVIYYLLMSIFLTSHFLNAFYQHQDTQNYEKVWISIDLIEIYVISKWGKTIYNQAQLGFSRPNCALLKGNNRINKDERKQTRVKKVIKSPNIHETEKHKSQIGKTERVKF